ncbi:hypothetical protein FKM82_024443 [Ascaphus truei]
MDQHQKHCHPHIYAILRYPYPTSLETFASLSPHPGHLPQTPSPLMNSIMPACFPSTHHNHWNLSSPWLTHTIFQCLTASSLRYHLLQSFLLS